MSDKCSIFVVQYRIDNYPKLNKNNNQSERSDYNLKQNEKTFKRCG